MYVFDLDGTLIDSNGLWREVDEEFLGRRGLVPTDEYEDVAARSIFPVAAAFTKEYYHLPDSPQDIMDQWETLAEDLYLKRTPLKPGAAELLERLWAKGERLALFTACRPALCRGVLARFGLTGYFEAVIYAEEIGLDKHDPQCFVRLSQKLGEPLGSCVLLDDSPANCATAKAAGMRVVGVFDPFYASRWDEMAGVCDRRVRSLTELLEGTL